MSKLEPALEMDPAHELHFAGPFTEVSTSKLKLTNPTTSRICFKVKTTAPKMYCVRPNSGLIEPGQSITISVMLQPVPNYDHTEKCRHKFMVQTMFAPDTKFDSQEALWKDADPDSLMASRLRCVFDFDNQNNLSPVEEDHEVEKKAEKMSSLPVTKTETGESDETLTEENRHLKSKIEQLQQELAKLKTQEVRMRKMAVEDTVTSTPQYAPPSPTSTSAIPSFVYLIAALILGFIIGKLIF